MLKTLTDILTKPLINENIDITSMIIGFTLAALLSFVLSLIYKRLNHGREEVHLMMQSLIVLSMTIAAAMMIVGNELARAFGLVGAVSVIRFRTAVQNYRDMAFVFISIVIGMACGLEFYILACVIGISTGGILFLLGILRYGQKKDNLIHYTLRIIFNHNNLTRDDIENELHKRNISFCFCGMKMADKRSWFEYSIEAGEKSIVDELVASLREKLAEHQAIIRIILAKK
jgi:uncharacterized membrane protein YhiD involved in acid resistance